MLIKLVIRAFLDRIIYDLTNALKPKKNRTFAYLLIVTVNLNGKYQYRPILRHIQKLGICYAETLGLDLEKSV